MKSNIKKHMGFHNYSKSLANLEAFHIVISLSMNIFSLKSELEIAIRVLFFYSKKFGKLNQNFSSNCAQYYLVKIRFYAQKEQNFFFSSFYVSWTISIVPNWITICLLLSSHILRKSMKVRFLNLILTCLLSTYVKASVILL